jgi:hypothetical protein
VAPHDPDDGAGPDELVQGVGDGVVVDRPQQRDEGVVVEGGVPHPLVGKEVRRRLVASFADSRVELVGGVQRGAVGVDRRVRVGGEDQRVVRTEVGAQRGGEPAAEDHEPLHVGAREQAVLVCREVQVLQPQPGERPARREHGVEIGEVLDLGVRGVHAGAVHGPTVEGHGAGPESGP